MAEATSSQLPEEGLKVKKLKGSQLKSSKRLKGFFCFIVLCFNF